MTLKLTKTRLTAGVWEGVLTGAEGDNPPVLTLSHRAEALDPPQLEPMEDGWRVRASVPVELLSDGVQTFVVADAETGETLASFAFLSGDALSEDIRAEMELLRGELDMLKRAFRRHCLETMDVD